MSRSRRQNGQHNKLQKHPAWREALEKFREEDFQYDDIVSHEWLHEALGLEVPSPDTPWKKVKQTQLEYMANMDRLREALQLEDLLYLESERSLGYRVVPPSEQTAIAMEKAAHRMNQVLRQTARIVGNIRTQELTDQQKKENMDARAKISSIAGLAKRISGPF